MASAIHYVGNSAATTTLDAAAIGSGSVIEKFNVRSGTQVTVFGPAVKILSSGVWEQVGSGGQLITVAAGQTVEGPFTKIITNANVFVLAYIK